MQPAAPFRILIVSLNTGGTQVVNHGGSADCLGGSGLAASLYERYGHPEEPALSPCQPLIFAIGPLTGLFPMMSKVVCGFVSPHTGQYAESHAGGRLPWALKLAGIDALVITGRAPGMSWLGVDRAGAEVREGAELAGQEPAVVHARVRAMLTARPGRTSVACIGPAAENGCTFGCITVDRHRHFGRLGAGTVLASKNLKAFAVVGDDRRLGGFGSGYKTLRRTMHDLAAKSPSMEKYRGVGTAQIISSLNALGSLPWRNLRATSREGIEALSGERMPEAVPVRRAACTGCPVGCIRLAVMPGGGGDVGFDFEHMACCGSMLALSDPHEVLSLLTEVERQGMDVMSAGGCLAWACEASEKGIIGVAETGMELRFGDAQSLVRGLRLLGRGETPFWKELAQGVKSAARVYGGKDFACVLGQEMAGYASGPTFFAAQAMNFRHSHLDNACYSYDLECGGPPEDAVRFLLRDEHRRVMVNCMVGCLFGRHIYSTDVLAECLDSVGHWEAASHLDELAEDARRRRWRLKFATGFNPDAVRLPKRFSEVVTPNGAVTVQALEAVRSQYAKALEQMLGAED
ncbi:aldehyde ferredoxin oxidoreductase C-terminal domain-containing protein [Desulfovibrio ferrophilus]|uniref:Aldehyde ferredoxin oxidoreductase n=1 Tax=Desulfovibrio ferrophilus TaxID=241368 RepID=A0A2Z6AU69_9BACT|nr:aldehyde ferredoxin oxidoreductase C-terminal domain-containing protein [Desulfovibrio ferrophilus]BBD06768.1 aldehyde ferredoxin oxidoreductase [Desulfovibrio ferrophilus]